MYKYIPDISMLLLKNAEWTSTIIEKWYVANRSFLISKMIFWIYSSAWCEENNLAWLLLNEHKKASSFVMTNHLEKIPWFFFSFFALLNPFLSNKLYHIRNIPLWFLRNYDLKFDSGWNETYFHFFDYSKSWIFWKGVL